MVTCDYKDQLARLNRHQAAIGYWCGWFALLLPIVSTAQRVPVDRAHYRAIPSAVR